jgi:hypothetical protein
MPPGRVVSVVVAMPASGRLADRDPDEPGPRAGEALGDRRVDDRAAHVATGEPVVDVRRGKQRGRRDDHGPETHAGEQRLPERWDIPEHDQDAVAAPHPPIGEEASHAPRAVGELLERQRGRPAPFLGNDQGRASIPGGVPIEIVGRPVPAIELGPGKLPHRAVMIFPARHQEIAGAQKPRERRHGSDHTADQRPAPPAAVDAPRAPTRPFVVGRDPQSRPLLTSFQGCLAA